MAVRAIIVDDSETARVEIKYRLGKLGCVVVGEAANAAEGVKLFAELKPEIVTMDLVMPKEGEIDAMAAIREIKKQRPNTAVIVISALGSQEEVATYRAEGIFDYIVKPVNQFSFDSLQRNLPKRFPELRRPLRM